MKKLLDKIISFIVLFVLSPVIVIITILVGVDLGFPLVFKQIRPGFNAQPFAMFKFRTMRSLKNDRDEDLIDSERLTKFGQFLRSTSLDELPGLWCVLKGDMSLVGPRPLLMEYLPLYTKDQARRHEVKPGITGWAQVNGRNAISWEEKFKLDVWYVDNQSSWLDLKILFLTVLKVFKREGISADGEVTMSKFTGSKIV